MLTVICDWCGVSKEHNHLKLEEVNKLPKGWSYQTCTTKNYRVAILCKECSIMHSEGILSGIRDSNKYYDWPRMKSYRNLRFEDLFGYREEDLNDLLNVEGK
jgi:hypothetical protein